MITMFLLYLVCCHNMVLCNTVLIIWYSIAILYGNIVILYGTQRTLSIDTYNTVGLRRISFFSEIRSPRSVTPFFDQRPPSPPKKKMPPRRSPYRLVISNDRIIMEAVLEEFKTRWEEPRYYVFVCAGDFAQVCI